MTRSGDSRSFHIRPEGSDDADAIHSLTETAFKTMPYSDGSEPKIIRRLRALGDLTFSFVALDDAGIIGHVAFSPVSIPQAKGDWYGLGPISVMPPKQAKGVGSALVERGLAELVTLGATGCVLVGDNAYYQRFGFKADGQVSYQDVPAQYVQWISFDGNIPSGEITYSAAFTAQ